MVFYHSLVVATFVAGASARTNFRAAPVRFENAERKLSYEFIAGYRPDSQVTDHNAIDLDQNFIAKFVGEKTGDSFELARAVYEQGGHSKSYAKLKLTDLTGSFPTLNDGDKFTGKNTDGVDVVGKVYKSSKSKPNGEIWLQYQTNDDQQNYVGCQVGGLGVSYQNTKECFATSGTITENDGGSEYTYTYDINADNDNGRTIQGFSTAVQSKMLEDCKGCPYADAEYYFKYYGNPNYGDIWVQAALSGDKTDFKSGRGNADFATYDFEGRAECVKKGTAYLNVFMYVIREFEDALDDCVKECIYCNDDPVHAWDEGVAFYAGSLEGEAGEGSGELLHQLADKRCKDYNTCVEGSTVSKVNSELQGLFNVGQGQLQIGKCDAARITKSQVADLMYIPLIQGTIRYAHKIDKLGLNLEKEKAEGTVFAASILPRIFAVNEDAANTIYDNMRVGATSTNYKAVRDAFESVYSDLNINCADIGGLVDSTGAYYEGAAPCSDESTEPKSTSNVIGIAIGAVVCAIAVGSIGYIFFLRSRSKQGKPVFAPSGEGAL